MKRRSKKQTVAQKRNFSIFRLRGMVASLNTIMLNGNLCLETNLQLLNADSIIRRALRTETGK